MRLKVLSGIQAGVGVQRGALDAYTKKEVVEEKADRCDKLSQLDSL